MCAQLKRWKVRVAANDPMIWAYTKATALIENDSERLSEDEIESILDDAYVPRERLDNPSLLNWFNETDAWWFDNVRFNAERLDTQYKRAVALTLGMMVGDYVLSFTEDSRHLREPLSLSRVFRQFAETIPFPYDNSLRSKATNQDVRAFVAERRHTDLLFLRLPAPVQPQTAQHHPFAWREEWLQGGDDFWGDFEKTRAGKLGSRVQSKQQYLLGWLKICSTPPRTCPPGPSRIRKMVSSQLTNWSTRLAACAKWTQFIQKTFRICWACARRLLRR